MSELLSKALKIRGDFAKLGVSYTHIPVFSYADVGNFFYPTGNIWVQGGYSQPTWNPVTIPLQALGGSTVEDLYNHLSHMSDTARIFNRAASDITVGANFDFAIFSNDGIEITADTETIYRPGVKCTEIQGASTANFQTGIGYGCVSNSTSSTAGAGYWYMRLNAAATDSKNYLYAVECRNSSGDITGYQFCLCSSFLGNNNITQYEVTFIEFNLLAYQRIHGYTIIPVDTKPQADEEFTDETSTEDGYDGQGAFDHTSDVISVPDDPSVHTGTLGFYHKYLVSNASLSALGQYLFPDILGSLVNADLEGILRAFASVFAYRDNVQYIVDLHAIPVSPTAGGSEYIQVGALSTDISVPTISSDYVTFDCGAVSIPENFASFMDYSGTRARLFLPFVGFVDIKPEFFQGGTLSVRYKFNVIDGSFMAYVISTSSKSQLANSVIGQYGGSACIHFPVVAEAYGAMAAGLVTGSMSLAANAASGNALGTVTGALTAINMQPSVAQSNNYNASTSFLGVRRPYLMIERIVPNFAAYYNLDEGIPANVTMPLANVQGYTEIANIDFIGQTFASAEELEEIRTLLAGGVFF